MMVSMIHQTMFLVTIAVGKDLGHCLKKNRNHIHFSGINGHNCEIVLDKQPMTLMMLYNVWKNTLDFKNKGSIMLESLVKGKGLVNSPVKVNYDLFRRVTV